MNCKYLYNPLSLTTSHTTILVSLDPETSREPVEENLKQETALRCPLRVIMHFCCFRFHILIVPEAYLFVYGNTK